MSEVVTIGDATLVCGDCLEAIPALQRAHDETQAQTAAVIASAVQRVYTPRPFAHAVVTDPPYGINLHALTGTGRENIVVRDVPLDVQIVGDDKPFDPAPFLGFAKVILWGGIHFHQRLPDSRAWLVWDKRDGTTSDNQADCEIAWSNLPGPARLYTHLWRGYARAGEENLSNGPKLHPAQKPIALLDWCMRIAKLETGQTVLDPFMGSGSAGVAALRRGLRYVGVEIERRYFDIACERIDNELRQSRIFA